MKFLVYVAVLLSTAACLALGLDFLTRPETASKLDAAQTEAASPKSKPAGARQEPNAQQPDQTATATGAVRQIPIVGKANAGDPNNDLTPIYPAAPGKDLPIKDAAAQPDAPAKQAAAPAPASAPAETNGTAPSADTPAPASSASAAAPSQPAASPPTLRSSLQTQAAAPNSCNVAACAAAYRSFRESDCTYQPYEGPRQVCTGAPDTAAVSTSPQQAARDNRGRYDNQPDAARTVRRLPAPNADYEYDDDDYDDGEAAPPPPDMSRYGLRQNWIIERQ